MKILPPEVKKELHDRRFSGDEAIAADLENVKSIEENVWREEKWVYLRMEKYISVSGEVHFESI